MKKLFYILTGTLLFLSMQPVHGQMKSSIGDSEYAFARTAERDGIKRAFESYMAPHGYIVVGHHITNALAYYSGVPNDTTDLLWWRPNRVFANNDNDFGFATGPFRYFRTRHGNAVAAGHTFSIWEKNKDGIYKILFDGGVNLATIPSDSLHDLERNPIIQLNFNTQSSWQMSVEAEGDFPGSNKVHKNAVFLRPNKGFMLNWELAEAVQKMVKKPMQEGFDRTGKTFYRFGNLGKDETSLKEGKFCGYFAQVWSRHKNEWVLIADVMQY
ncbi:MAG: hypothetical protein ACN6O7_02605 [Sphingobacterium sp.]